MILLLALGPFAVVLITTLISTGISFAIGAITGKPGTGSGSTPGFDRLANSKGEGAFVPVVLGKEHPVEPLLISVVLRTEGQKQAFDLLYVASHGTSGDPGDIRKSGRLKINGEKVGEGNYPDLEIHHRTGTANQDAIPGFNKVGSPFDIGLLLEGPKDGNPAISHEYEMRADAKEIQILLTFASGLYRISKSKGVRGVYGGVKIEYRDATKAHDPLHNPWRAAPLDKPQNPDWENSVSGLGQFPSGVPGYFYTRASSTSPVRRQIELVFPTKGRYVVRVSGVIESNAARQSEPTLSSVIEITQSEDTYPWYQLIALKGVVTDSLGGSVPSIEWLSPGLLVTNDPATGNAVTSENPFILAREVFQNTRWGLGFPVSLDVGVGSSWQDAIDRAATLTSVAGGPQEPLWRLNYLIADGAPGEDHIRQILQTCRAHLIEHDGLVRIVQDIAGSSVRTFDARKTTDGRQNVVAEQDGRSSLRRIPPPQDEQYDGVVIAFLDADDEYREKTVTWPEGSTPKNPLELNYRGVAHRTQAAREARYQYLLATLTPDFWEWRAGWGDHDLLPMDVVAVNDDHHGLTSALLRLYATGHGSRGEGRMVARDYDAGVYANDPVSSLFSTRETNTSAPAVKKLPPGVGTLQFMNPPVLKVLSISVRVEKADLNVVTVSAP